MFLQPAEGVPQVTVTFTVTFTVTVTVRVTATVRIRGAATKRARL